MKEAHVIVSVLPGSINARLDYFACDLPHLVSAAEELERYARRPVDHVVHAHVHEVEGRTFDDDTQVALVKFRDDEYELRLFLAKLKPFHAFGAAAVLRQHAQKQFLAEVIVQAHQAMAQVAANGGAQVGPQGIILPRG